MRSNDFNRRDLLQLLTAGAAAALPVRAAEPPLQFSSIEKVEFSVTDLDRSIKFYASIFGPGPYKNKRAEKHYLKLGPAYLGIDRADLPRVNNHSLGIKGIE